VVPVTPEAAREVARRMVEAQLRVGTIARIEPDYLQQLGLK